MRHHRRTNPPAAASNPDDKNKAECTHPALFNSMCVACGQTIKAAANTVSMNLALQRPRDPFVASHQSRPESADGRNPLLAIKKGGGLLQLSREDVKQVQQSKVSALRKHKKLALVLDLDHTLLHAVQMDGPAPTEPLTLPQDVDYRPFIAQQRKVAVHRPDTTKRHAEIPLIHHLPIEEIVGGQIRHLVMKKRTHLDVFLQQVQSFCQLTIYTAGTRRYAEAVAKVIDPTRKLFAERIISRSDVPNVRNDGNDKSLERLFLGDSSMAVIMDDREDVWSTGNQCKQLLLVRPFVHFDPAVTASQAAGKLSVGSSNNSILPPPATESLAATALHNIIESSPESIETASAPAAPVAIQLPIISLRPIRASSEGMNVYTE